MQTSRDLLATLMPNKRERLRENVDYGKGKERSLPVAWFPVAAKRRVNVRPMSPNCRNTSKLTCMESCGKAEMQTAGRQSVSSEGFLDEHAAQKMQVLSGI